MPNDDDDFLYDHMSNADENEIEDFFQAHWYDDKIVNAVLEDSENLVPISERELDCYSSFGSSA